MTATQAPTPSPLTFGAGKLVVDTGRYHGSPAVFICAAKVGGSVGSSAAVENNPTDCLQPNETVLIFPTMEQAKVVADALVLAPTAPVEASGSEREEDALEALDWIENVFPGQGDTNDQGVTVRGWQRLDQACATIRTALSRPQPSGETREAVARIVDQIEVVSGAAGPRIRPGEKARVTNAILALLSARPLALGGQHSSGEDAAWSWLNRHVQCDPADRDYSADEMVDAFMAGAGRYDIWLKALERIAGEQQHRSGYCQTDITVEPALTAEEAQTVARDALSTTPARAEAQDEGAAGDDLHQALTLALALLGQMEPTDARAISDEFVAMAAAQAGIQNQEGRDIIAARLKQPFPSIPAEVTFEDAHPSPTPAADEDRAREALKLSVDALFDLKAAFVKPGTYDGAKGKAIKQAHVAHRSALAALKSTAAKEGGE